MKPHYWTPWVTLAGSLLTPLAAWAEGDVFLQASPIRTIGLGLSMLVMLGLMTLVLLEIEVRPHH